MLVAPMLRRNIRRDAIPRHCKLTRVSFDPND